LVLMSDMRKLKIECDKVHFLSLIFYIYFISSLPGMC
jgi:hypothetical protein